MGIKKLFTIPAGEKVTEKALRRVLISSICSILLCMTCLVSTTWAWFAVSIENTGIVIEIGTPEINLTVDDCQYDPATELSTGIHAVQFVHANEPDDLNRKSTLYVTLIIRYSDGTVTMCTPLSQENEYKTEITIVSGQPCILTWDVSWFPPANAVALTDETNTVIIPEPTVPVTTEGGSDVGS